MARTAEDPTPEEIERAKAEIRAEHLRLKRESDHVPHERYVREVIHSPFRPNNDGQLLESQG